MANKFPIIKNVNDDYVSKSFPVIDPSNLLYSTSNYDNYAYTATEDCFISAYRTQYQSVISIYDSQNNPASVMQIGTDSSYVPGRVCCYLGKGQTAKGTGSVRVYGIKY